MRTEEQIRERVEMYRRLAEKIGKPGDPKCIESVVGAMKRQAVFSAVADELEWVLK